MATATDTDKKVDTQELETPTNAKKNEDNGEKLLTQEQFDAGLKERLARAEAKHKAETERLVAEAKAEAERLATMSAEEKAKELANKQAKELGERERQLALRENKLKAIDEFDKLQIPIKLVDLVVDADADIMASKIEAFKQSWQTAVSQAVEKQLKGDAPQDLAGKDAKTTTPKVLTSF